MIASDLASITLWRTRLYLFMGAHEEKKEHGLLDSFFHVLGGAAEAGHGLAEEHHSKSGEVGGGLLGSVLGALRVDRAMDTCAENKFPDCVLDTVGGMTSMANGLAGMAKGPVASSIGKILGPIGTGLDVIEAVRAFSDGDVMGGVGHSGSALLGLFGQGAAAPALHAGLWAGGHIGRFGEASAIEHDYYGGHRGYTDAVADEALDHWAPAYEHLPAWYVHSLAAPEVLQNGAKEGVKSAGRGAYDYAHDSVLGLMTGMQRAARHQAFMAAQRAPSDHRWSLDNPLAPIRATACYERNDPHAIMQAFGHYAD